MARIKGKQIDDATIANGKLVSGSTYLRNDGSGFPMTVDMDLGNFKIINLAPGVAGTDAVNVNQLNAAQGGLDPKDSCDVATAAALTSWIAAGSGVGKTLTSPDNLTSNNDFDGFTVSVGMRVLVKNGGPNGNIDNLIYTVTQLADGVSNPAILTRSTDTDEDSEVTTGLFTFIVNGNTNALTSWVVTTPDPIVVDTTAVVFALFSIAPTLIAGAGLVQVGNVIDVGQGDGITVNANDVAVNVTDFAGTGLENDGSNNLRIAAAAAGAGLVGGGGAALAVGAGNAIVVNANDVAWSATAAAGAGLENDGSDNLRIAAAAAGAGLVGGGGIALAVGAGDGITVNADDVAVNVTAFAGTGLENDGSNNLRIAAAAAGAGLGGGGGAALVVNVGNGIQIDTDAVAILANVTTSPTQPRATVAADGGGLWAASRVTSDKNLTPTPTAGDGASTGITPTDIAAGYIALFINGIFYQVGNGVKTLAAYFSKDGGVTADFFNDVNNTTSVLFWNGVTCGFDLDGADRIDLEYDAV